MKKNTMYSALLIGCLCFLSTLATAQVDTTQNAKNAALLQAEIQQNEQLKNEATQTAAQKNANRLQEAQSLSKENKAIAKTASRVDHDAATAARDSRRAVAAEKKAQKQRIKADKLAAKAAQSTAKSNQN